MPRPTKYSKARTEALCALLRDGCTRTAAAESLGIGYETFRRWMTDKEEFWGAVTRAEAEAEAMFTTTMAKAARGTATEPGDWRAAESWLKRRRRVDYGDSVDIRKLDDQTLLRLLDLAGGGEAAGLDTFGGRADHETPAGE